MAPSAAPSPIPGYLTHTPSSSRSSSVKSNRPGHLHPQHRDYIPNNNQSTIEPNAASGAAYSQTILQDEYESDSDCSEIGDGMLDSVTWTEIKASHLSNKKWYRRPSPGWVFPFIIGAALSLGMNIAPKQELYISLACLAHPPRMDATPDIGRPGKGWDREHDDRTIPTMPISRKPMPMAVTGHESALDDIWLQVASNVSEQRTPFDEWFIKRQKEDWARRHHVVEIGGDGQEPDEGEEEYEEIDPRLCKRDPGVQAVAAKFTMVMTLTMGILAALTTGFWGQQSDKIGRTRIMAISEFGLFCSDVSFILVATFPNMMPGGYRFLIIGPIIDGALGGVSTLIASINAYISDVTPDGSRAKVFSRLTGIMMLGFAAGPAIGSFVIDRSGNILLPFYVTSAIHLLYIFGILGFLPESLSPDARSALSKNTEIARATARRNAPINVTVSRSARDWLVSWFGALTIFLPRTVDGRRGKDWSLACLAGAVFLMNMMMGILQVKGQYLLYTYGWTSSQLGPYLTLMGISRGVALLVVLPTLFYFFRPRAPAAEPGATEQTPLVAANGKTPHSIREAKFDLVVLRVSVLIEMTAYAAMTIVVSAATFTVLTAFVTFGAGGLPAATSLALALLPSQRDTGKLFGGLAMLNALSTTLLGPLLFGSVFAATVATHATAVFALAGGLLAVAQIILAFVRVPDGRLDEEEVRGRSRGSKAVGRGGASQDEAQ